MSEACGADAFGELLDGILDRSLTEYHRGEGHGGADAVGVQTLDSHLVSASRRAFQEVDLLPADSEVWGVIENDEVDVLGEGYHVMTLVEHLRRFVIKYAKSDEGIPPLATLGASQADRCQWSRDHSVLEDGRLHPAIWQHVRAFESYGELALPCRVYVSDDADRRLNHAERRALDRFRSIGIVRPMAGPGVQIRAVYTDEFPTSKRPETGTVTVSVMVVQPLVIPLADAMFQELQVGNPAGVSRWIERYSAFVGTLWKHGVSHLDFSILNVGVLRHGDRESLAIFDPHMGVIELSPAGPEVRDPLASRPEEQRSLEELLVAARDGSRWAVSRIQDMAARAPDVPQQRVGEAAEIVRDFHLATGEVEQEEGLFSRPQFERTWHRQTIRNVNVLAGAQARQLVLHPVWGLLEQLLQRGFGEQVYHCSLPTVGMEDESVLAQFRAGLTVYEGHPLLLVANVARDAARLVKHWGRVVLPGELDVQDDPGIHYHFHDLLTGEIYERSGETLRNHGLVVGLEPLQFHAFHIEDILVDDLILEQALAGAPDFSDLLHDCTKRVGVVGDVHGDLDALKEVLRGIGFIDSSHQWFAGDATLVLTGDIGHGPNLAGALDYIQLLSRQAHELGGKVVWTLGNHDLFSDRDGGQGGEDSEGFRLWPAIRKAALQPSAHPGLIVTAAYYGQEKIFVHGGVLPHIVRGSAPGGGGYPDPSQVVQYINDAFLAALAERERIGTQDVSHQIFRIGTSHTRDPRFPDQEGYEPAGVFTADLRELDYYRYRDGLLPQVVGHTASKTGQIRYSPGSWRRREFIGTDVGRQKGTGNGGLLLTELGWMAVKPGGSARLIEAAPLLVDLAHQAAPDHHAIWTDERIQHRVHQTVSEYLRGARRGRRPAGQALARLHVDLPPTRRAYSTASSSRSATPAPAW